ncbi:MAG: hypothetical protein H5T86_14335, partial [Armatimonadetes bacterium]|nr:hypothetical protein [Armatimonadota bacterium]
MASVATGDNGHGALNPLGVRLVSPGTFIAGSKASVRVIVTDHARGVPARGAEISLRLSDGDGTKGHPLASGRADESGSLNATFIVPELEPGRYKIWAEASYRDRSDQVVQDVQLRRAYRLMLVTDKPLYQPSQTIHMRLLALREPTLEPARRVQAVFEVKDPKGNKVFKKSVETNEMGAAWADFPLADEINVGRYECSARTEDAEAKRTVTVDLYVLPKFKVVATTDRDFYMPGQKLSGTVSAEYFFGKPVAGGRVEISAKTFDVEYAEIAKVTGRTDSQGHFDFELSLPSHFVGQPLEQGKAFVQLEVKVTDTADHTEKITVSRPVAAQELEIRAVPESGK